MKKIIKRTLLAVVCLMLVAIIYFCSAFIYHEFFRATTVDTQVSPDGRYTLYLQQIGSPGWPFGPVTAQVMLKEGDKTIKKEQLEVYNDGGPVWEEQWTVEWRDDSVKITVELGEMDGEEIFEFFFD